MSLEVPASAPALTEGQLAVPVKASTSGLRIPSWLRALGQFAIMLVLVVASYLVFSRLVLQTVQVVGRSMMPTLHDSERCLLNRWVYHFRSPQAGDIVVLRDPIDHSLAVKRIVAKAGDEIYLADGQVQINGHIVREPYLRPGTHTYPNLNLKHQSLRCGPDQFLVLGDNRMDSTDSRAYGPISRDDILGLIVQ